jgi:mannose-6-phosphate isomerase-like protein (cupin superfamily)
VKESGVTFPEFADLEISHHYGLERFYEYGLTMITVVNREYCKKILILLSGQAHPEQYHRKKEETFHVLWGSGKIRLNGKEQDMKPGDVFVIQPGTLHYFSSENGLVLEEISSTHYVDDSFYTDEAIHDNKNRKTFITHWRMA